MTTVIWIAMAVPFAICLIPIARHVFRGLGRTSRAMGRNVDALFGPSDKPGYTIDNRWWKARR